mmetsp:Transcript_59404/g.145380  ORF Transcript_59404/g.145380 Transcript_59404/m.145380 type:complete len:98 (-) Transcript_59404:356-649(-)
MRINPIKINGNVCSKGLNRDVFLSDRSSCRRDDLLLILCRDWCETKPAEIQNDAAPTSISPYPSVSVLQNRLGKTWKSTAKIATYVKYIMLDLYNVK